MKRLLLLILLLTVPALSMVQAAPDAQDDRLPVVGLAEYAPFETDMYAAIRIDDAYFDTLTDVINNLIGKLPPEANIPLIDVGEAIDANIPFDIEWVGDTAAVYIPSLEEAFFGNVEFPFIIAAEVDDFETALAFFDLSFEDDYIRMQREDGSVLYNARFPRDASVLVTDSMFFVGTFDIELQNIVLPETDTRSLTQNSAFTDAVDALPEGDTYNAFAYVNLASMADFIVEFVPMVLGEQLPPEFTDIDYESAVGQLALGAVIYDERALVLDVALTGDALAEFAAADPVDLSLLEHAPADTVVSIQGTDFGPRMIELIDLFATLDSAIDMLQPGMFDGMGPLRPASISTFLRLSFEGTYNMDLDQTLGALDGDFLFYLSANYDAEAAALDFGSNALFVSSDPENTAQFIEEIATIAQDSFNPAIFEDGRLDIPFGAVLSMPDLLTLTVASDDTLAVVGSPSDVSFALEPGDDALAASDAFIYDNETLILDDVVSFWYVNPEPASVLITELIDMGIINNEYQARDAADVALLLSLLDSATLSVATPDGEAVILRATLTFSE